MEKSFRECSVVRCPESRSVHFSEVNYVLYIAVAISIRATDFVRCKEVVRLSEGPLWEVRLYNNYTRTKNIKK